MFVAAVSPLEGTNEAKSPFEQVMMCTHLYYDYKMFLTPRVAKQAA